MFRGEVSYPDKHVAGLSHVAASARRRQQASDMSTVASKANTCKWTTSRDTLPCLHDKRQCLVGRWSQQRVMSACKPQQRRSSCKAHGSSIHCQIWPLSRVRTEQL